MWIKIITISKKEALQLNNEYGVPFGSDGISRTYAKHKSYFLCENKYNLNVINKIRNESIVK